MSGLGDSIGTAIEGGLLGRAVEPGAGEAGAHAAGPVTCPNCSTRYHGHFCPECGQNGHIHRSLAAIGHDIMHGNRAPRVMLSCKPPEVRGVPAC
jgi:hypothetical protein